VTGVQTCALPICGTLRLTYAAATPDYIWSGASGNWSTGFTPTAPVTDKNLVFTGSTGTATNDIASGTLSSINFITFNSTAGAYTLNATTGAAGLAGGTALTVKGDILNNSSNAQTIAMNLAFGSSSTGGVDTAAGNITISGNISGTGALNKAGNSTLTLTGVNTYTGTTTINAGTLQIGNNSSASIASSSIVNNANLIYSTNISSGTTSLASSITGTGNLTATAKLLNLNGNITIERNSVSDPIYPTWGSKITLSSKFTLPYHWIGENLQGKTYDYEGMSQQKRFEWVEYYKIKFTAHWYTALNKHKTNKFVLNTNVRYNTTWDKLSETVGYKKSNPIMFMIGTNFQF
jgi:autotransporter-associated beta strand protein